MLQQSQIQYGRRTITFSVRYHERKTLAIYVHSDQSVEVRSPHGVPLEEIEKRVLKRTSWILKQQRYFSSFSPPWPPRRYISGETYWYLGRQYRLRLIEAEQKRVVLHSGWLHISRPDTSDKTAIREQLETWYRERAGIKFHEYLQHCVTKFTRYGIHCDRIYLRTMPKRWGSCTPAGKILLNPNLIKTPSVCIEYVITHELCHLIEPTHSKAFYELQARMMPDWERWKNKLETFSFI